jgi:hypothetical protein
VRNRFTCIAVLAIGAAIGATLADAQTSRRPHNLHQAISTAHAEAHMVSLVILSKSYVALDADKLRAKLDETFPGEFVPQRDQGSFVVDGPVERAQFLIQSRVANAAGTFMLNSVPGPYTKFSDFAKFIKDRAIRRQARAQRSWLSIDLIAKHTTEDDAYRFIGRALAVLAPRDAAYLVHPSRRVVVAFDDNVRRRLANGEQIDAKSDPK